VQPEKVATEPESHETPPEFPEIVQLTNLAESSMAQSTPPPEFREIVQFVKFGEDLMLRTPPEFPEILQFVRVGEQPQAQYTPNEVFEIVQFVSVGDELPSQQTPYGAAGLQEIVQSANAGFSPSPMTTPPPVPPVTRTPDIVAPVRSPHTVPWSTVVSAPAPRMLTP